MLLSFSSCRKLYPQVVSQSHIHVHVHVQIESERPTLNKASVRCPSPCVSCPCPPPRLLPGFVLYPLFSPKAYRWFRQPPSTLHPLGKWQGCSSYTISWPSQLTACAPKAAHLLQTCSCRPTRGFATAMAGGSGGRGPSGDWWQPHKKELQSEVISGES